MVTRHVLSLEETQCPGEKVDKWGGKKRHGNSDSTEMTPLGSNIREATTQWWETQSLR